MDYRTRYRSLDTAWRFISHRSGQPAASDRSLRGGDNEPTALVGQCRTPR